MKENKLYDDQDVLHMATFHNEDHNLIVGYWGN